MTRVRHISLPDYSEAGAVIQPLGPSPLQGLYQVFAEHELMLNAVIASFGIPAELTGDGVKSMTEAEWLASDNPVLMLEWMTDSLVGPPAPSARKYRLFAIAIFSAHEPLSEDLMDGYEKYGVGYSDAEWARRWVLSRNEAFPKSAIKDRIPQAQKASLLREIIGNPFRPVTPPRRIGGKNVLMTLGDLLESDDGLVCTWLTWNDGIVVKMAQAIHDERAFDRLPILADALEDAGCDDESILRHLRGQERCHDCFRRGIVPNHLNRRTLSCPICDGGGWCRLRGPHVRGCFVLDLLRGVE